VARSLSDSSCLILMIAPQSVRQEIREPKMAARPQRVMIVDDMDSVRQIVRYVLEGDPMIEVVGEAGDPYEARQEIKRLNPDVLTLDVEMPRMNGDQFLRKIMELRPMPVVMLSHLTKRGSDIAVRALADGAIECIEKPQRIEDMAEGLFSANLRRAVHTAAHVELHRRTTTIKPVRSAFHWNGNIVLIGSSTGGVEALETVFSHYPANCPPTVVAQHMPQKFIESFVARLNQLYPFEIKVAENRETPVQGTVYFVPGGETDLMIADPKAPKLLHRTHSSEFDFCPSVDFLFDSGAVLGARAVGAVLTGMGRDGAEGLMAMRNSGAATVAQDEATSVVFGMPRAARDMGAVQTVAPSQKIGGVLLDRCRKAANGADSV
jgi:two-component system chemotaxis response regulator CheB